MIFKYSGFFWKFVATGVSLNEEDFSKTHKRCEGSLVSFFNVFTENQQNPIYIKCYYPISFGGVFLHGFMNEKVDL